MKGSEELTAPSCQQDSVESKIAKVCITDCYTIKKMEKTLSLQLKIGLHKKKVKTVNPHFSHKIQLQDRIQNKIWIRICLEKAKNNIVPSGLQQSFSLAMARRKE